MKLGNKVSRLSAGTLARQTHRTAKPDVVPIVITGAIDVSEPVKKAKLRRTRKRSK